MAGKVIEAKLLITAESRVEAEMAKVAKAIQQGLDVTKYTAEAAKLNKAWEQQAKAAKAAADVMDVRKPLEATVRGMQRVGSEAARLAREYDTAKKAAADFSKSSSFVKGSEQAVKMASEVRRLGEAHRMAVGETKALTAAFSAETAALRAAEGAASRLGVDLSRVEQQQRNLARSTDQAAAAFKRQIAVEDHAAKQSVVRQERSAARQGLVSAGAVVVGGKISSTAKAAEHSYAEFDMEIRRQVAMAGLTPAERQSRIDQAVRLGGSSTFNDIQVLHAQRTLAGRGVRKDLVEPFVEEIKDYAQAMNVDLPSAAKTLEGIVFSTNQHIDDAASAKKVMRRNVDLAVKTAKVGGLEDHDIQAAFKMGGATSTGAGFSIETMDTIFALLRKAGYSGEEAGTAARGISSKFIAPSKGGLTALDAMGVKYQNFVRMPDALNADRLGSSVKRTFGKEMSPRQMQRLQSLMNDPDALLDRDKFTADATGIIGQSFDKNKKGQLKAADAHAIAKTVGDFYKMAAESVDTEGLLRAVINAHPTQAQLNTLVTREHGGKLGSIAQKPELFDEYRKKIAETPEGFAKSIGDAVMGGFYGALKRIENTRLNVETAMGRSLDNNGENGGLLSKAASAIADFQQHIAELDPKLVAVGTSVAVVGGKIAEAAGTLGLMGSALALTKSAASLELAAARLAVGGGGLPDGGKKGGKLGSFVKGAAGMVGVGVLADLAQDYGVLQMPDLGKDGLGRSALNFLDPNLGNAVLGDRAKAMPSMTLAPGAMPLMIQGTGIGGFGLSGPVNPETAGKEAGEKVGTGVADGIKAKAGEVVEQGRSLLQKLNDQFREGIYLPINFGPGSGMGGGGGGSLIQRASFGGGGGGDLGGMIRRASLGGRSGGGGSGLSGVGGGVPRYGGGSGSGISARDLRNIDPQFAAHIRASALSQGIDPDIALRIANSEGLRGSNPNRLTPGDYENGKPTSFGPFQLHYGRSGGLGNRYTAETGHHASDPQHWKEQIDFALRTARKEGWGAWYGRRGAGIGVRDGIGTVKPVPMSKEGDPRLVRGLDGVEGLDLGNGTMRMPNGAIRSIPRGMPEIPEAPAGGIGGGGGRAGGISQHVEEFGRHVDRLADMGFHGQIEVTGLHKAGMRATALKVRGRGGLTADMGITEMGAKLNSGDPADWS